MKSKVLSPQQLMERGAEKQSQIRDSKARYKVVYGSLAHRKQKTKKAHEQAKKEKERYAAEMEAYWDRRYEE
jgi:hypothetical protein